MPKARSLNPSKPSASARLAALHARTDGLRRLLSSGGTLRSADLCQTLRLSQPTLSRALNALGEDVVRLGKARATRYALARPLGRLGHRWPLHHIDAQGRASCLGMLTAAGLHGFVLEPHQAESNAAWLDDGALQDAAGAPVQAPWFDTLPWFLQSLWPAGFLGRAQAKRWAAGGWVDPSLLAWRADDVVAMALIHGHDTPGNLVLGDHALQRALASIVEPREVLAASERGAMYPLMAQAVLQGELTEGWVTGEQPRFLAVVRGDASDGERPVSSSINQLTQALTSSSRVLPTGATAMSRFNPTHSPTYSPAPNLGPAKSVPTGTAARSPRDLRACMVKFSDRAPSAAGQRWADLLRCEAIASGVLNEQGIPAARCDVVKAAGRVFLEVARIDRSPLLGRLGLVRFDTVATHVLGASRPGERWSRLVALRDQGWLTPQDTTTLIKRGLFAALVGVDQPHEASTWLHLDAQRPLRLAPAVGLCPTAFAPKATGEVSARWLDIIPPPRAAFLSAWQEAATAASLHWKRVMGELGITLDFKVIGEDASRKLEAARHRWR
jgi:hypothetical protein